MTPARRLAEIIAIVACFTALRELSGRAVRLLHSEWSGPLYYAIWLAICAIAARTWGWPRWLPPRTAWSGRNLVVLAIVLVGTEWLYGFKVCRTVLGERSFHDPYSMVLLLNAVVAAPVMEELVFRGIVWDAVRTRSSSLVAIVVTSLMFAIWHWPSIFSPSWYGSPGTPLYMHALFGVLMGMLRWRFECIGLGLALHALYNGLWAVTG